MHNAYSSATNGPNNPPLPRHDGLSDVDETGPLAGGLWPGATATGHVTAGKRAAPAARQAEAEMSAAPERDWLRSRESANLKVNAFHLCEVWQVHFYFPFISY